MGGASPRPCAARASTGYGPQVGFLLDGRYDHPKTDLGSQDVEFQDFVIAHELLHLRVPNHGKLFKALMTAHVPDWREHEIAK